MKIEVIERVQNENLDLIKFVLDGASIELANAFRRIILTEVPTMAITEVLFIENDSVLFDEFIAHRLGLIPLTTDLKNYNLPDECSCNGEGCSLCQAEFICEIKATDAQRITKVYSRDIESMDKKIHPVNDDILLAKLEKGNSLVFEAYAKLGTGTEHAKFQPVCSIGYKYYPDVKIDHSKLGFIKKKSTDKNGDEVVELVQDDERILFETMDIIDKCPVKVFTQKDGKLALKEDYWKDCNLCGACERYSSSGGVEVGSLPNKFVFTCEGSGALPLKEVFEKATEIFLEKIAEFNSHLKKVKIIESPEL